MAEEKRKGFIEDTKEGVEDVIHAVAEEGRVTETALEKARNREEQKTGGAGIIEDTEREFVENATRRSIERALAVGSGLKEAVRGTMTGIVRGDRATGEAALMKIASTSEALIRNANNAGADLSQAAYGAIEGGIEVSRDVSINPEKAATAAATAVLATAEKIGSEAVRDVKQWTSAEIKGIPVRVRK